MIVEWRALAREDRSNLFDFIAADNPTAALELDDRIERLTDTLLEHPELYRVGRVRGTREMVLTLNYLLVYRVRKKAGVVEIVRILGARQSYPKARSGA
ncbi:type II toxin-antitoxin system RelE/ParE family toxin [Burkholderia pseudomallei]|uniref:type II toxin-antitoxin system RelE/ParE family toxin n=1 Tax=Burkholderia pseudomallei TaxID=28450 RepID=UPI00050FC181|nr:type II toxin-antitoxin system RelE/ParE family toxin [Burkholderia pseudomallei]KGC62075.1 addiction module toxin, RelE/StbE family protein [Burkholderia pseudomallei]